jgi:glycerophosphoryl diester phosphodiesterase
VEAQFSGGVRPAKRMDNHGWVHASAGRPPAAIGFAHRGARAERRENTLEAFARALELGATGLESDAWLTADGHVVLDHDGVTGPRWRRRAIATQLRADLPSHIPSLAELYRTCGRAFELSLDVKDPRTLTPILTEARAAGAMGQLWLCHQDWRVLAGWRAAGVEALLVASTGVRQLPGGLAAGAATVRRAGVDALNLHRRDWTEAGVETVHGVGLLAFGWDAQSRAEIARLLSAGVDGVYSDHVDRLMAAITGWRP